MASSAFSLERTSPKDGDAFISASIAEPTNLIPFLATDSSSAEISKLIFNGLVKYDKNLNLVGDLAASYEVQDNGLKIVFKLRQDVKWQDGKPFTADDVIFTFQKVTDPNMPTPYASGFEKVKSLTALDAYTVEVIYKEPFSPGLESWGMGIVPKHLLEKENIPTSVFAKRPIGTGPYKLIKWVTGEKLELSANDSYFEGRPHVSRYVYRIIPDQATIYLELATENLDTVNLSPLQYQRQTGSDFFKKTYQKYRVSSFAYTYLAYNLKNPLFQDKRVRQAIGLAIQKDEIIQVALMGLGKVATGPFLPDSWAHNSSVKPSVFDPKQAKKLLRGAGWEDRNGDGYLDKDGKKFEFTVITNQGNDQRKMACEMIQKRLQEIGIKMNIQIVEWGTFMRQFIATKNFDAVCLAWHLSLDPDIYDIFHSSKTRPGEFNFISYSSPKVDELLVQARQAFGVQSRAPFYHKIHELIHEDEPYTFLYVGEATPIIHKRFRGVEIAPIGIGHNFKDWYVNEKERRYAVYLNS